MVAANTAQAYLGGFEDADGYTNDYFSTTGPFGAGANNYLVNTYNAGAYTLPGGSPQRITANSGLWQAINGTTLIGNRYVIAHSQIGDESAYAGDAMLGIRNQGTSVSPLEIRYWLDSRDFGGLEPASTADTLIQWSLRVCPDASTAGGNSQSNSFYWTFRDTNLNAGLELGWNDQNQIIYRLPSHSLWQVTSFTLDQFNYDQMNMSFNLASDTWSLSIFDQSAQSTISLVTDAALGASMSNLSAIDWRLEYNQSKSYFDNSSFQVIPEPGTGILLMAAGIIAVRRRQR
ncbi:MAG: PEP-CTERM sorting domain-containing protein [Verrucomicrobia bacterium]|nr:PEP-CTERM sorting domain-containing protein [Verrucomicrobiota bacterium]